MKLINVSVVQIDKVAPWQSKVYNSIVTLPPQVCVINTILNVFCHQSSSSSLSNTQDDGSLSPQQDRTSAQTFIHYTAAAPIWCEWCFSFIILALFWSSKYTHNANWLMLIKISLLGWKINIASWISLLGLKLFCCNRCFWIVLHDSYV